MTALFQSIDYAYNYYSVKIAKTSALLLLLGLMYKSVIIDLLMGVALMTK